MMGSVHPPSIHPHHGRLSLDHISSPPHLQQDIGGKTPAELATSQVVLDMLADRQKAFTY